MFEVEVRGKLTEEEYQNLKKFLSANGEFKKNFSREIYQLWDYPGYDYDPTKREVDIRLRNTDGFCEVIMKHKISDGNVGRKETSLPLKESNLDNARKIFRAFGCKKARHIVRQKEIFMYNGVEWSLETCPPKNVRYFEAEKEAASEKDIEKFHQDLLSEAEKLSLKVLNQQEMKEFIYWLDDTVNEIVNL